MTPDTIAFTDKRHPRHVREGVFDMLEERLGPAQYAAPGVRMYRGDCISLMRRIKEPLFDLTVTSPPYNIGKAYESPMPIEAYVDWSAEWIQAVHSLTMPSGAFWLNLGYVPLQGRAKAIPLPYLLWNRIPFFLIQEIVWNYGAGVAAKSSFSPRNEKFLWYVKSEKDYTFNLDEVRDPDVKYPRQKKNGKLKCNPLGKNPSDVWQIPKVTSGADRSSPERMPHPAQFPVAVIDRIIRACSNPGDVLFDPFLGSGSTAEAALRVGRQVVGFEISDEYVRLAARRIDAFLKARSELEAQGSLL
jgi:adenine-specific DNA-methyltransferase